MIVNSTNYYLTETNVSVISLIMFYDNSKIMMYKLIGAVIYTIIDNYICFEYLGFLEDNLSKHDNKFENTKFKKKSGLGIT